MNTVIIGNIVSFIGCIMMVLLGFVKRKELIIKVQCLQFAVQGLANLILGGMGGVISNIIGITRNLVLTRRDGGAGVKLFFIGLQVALSMWLVGVEQLVDWFPVFATVIYTWFMDVKSDVKFKVLCIIAQSMWIAYDFHYLNYVSLLFGCFTVVSNFVGMYLIIRELRRKKQEDEMYQ